MNTRHSGSQNRRQDGQVTVEFALICIPFFAILFAIIDYAQIYFYENSLQNAMREAARFATAGRVVEQYYPNGSVIYETNNGVVMPKAIMVGSLEASRNECIKYWFYSNCVFGTNAIPFSNITIVSAPTLPGVPPVTETNSYNGDVTLLAQYSNTTNGVTTVTNGPAFPGPGNADDYIQITAQMTVRTLTPLMTYLNGYSHSMFDYPVKVSAIVKNEPALLNFLHPATNNPDQ